MTSNSVRESVGAVASVIIRRMSDAEIDRIFRSLDRIEARLLKLEEREAMRRGSDMTKGQLVAIIATISAVTGAVTAVVTQII